jgi:hypothetical protein
LSLVGFQPSWIFSFTVLFPSTALFHFAYVSWVLHMAAKPTAPTTILVCCKYPFTCSFLIQWKQYSQQCIIFDFPGEMEGSRCLQNFGNKLPTMTEYYNLCQQCYENLAVLHNTVFYS